MHLSKRCKLRKCGIDCRDAIFVFKICSKSFFPGGHSIIIALLDLSKTFDRVNHLKLFNSLLDLRVSITVVEVVYIC